MEYCQTEAEIHLSIQTAADRHNLIRNEAIYVKPVMESRVKRSYNTQNSIQNGLRNGHLSHSLHRPIIQ